jgi:hypothetical protein
MTSPHAAHATTMVAEATHRDAPNEVATVVDRHRVASAVVDPQATDGSAMIAGRREVDLEVVTGAVTRGRTEVARIGARGVAPNARASAAVRC